MNIPSKILIEAIEFAKTEPQVYANLALRDKTENLTAKSIRSEVIGISAEKQIIRIRIYVDYIPQNTEFIVGQDVVIDLIWSPVSGYAIENLFYYPSN